jgi:hypothetical protein
MTRTAAHRAPTAPALTPGQQLAARIAAALTILWAAAYLYGNLGRNPIADAAGATTAIWAASTNPIIIAATVFAVAAIRIFRPAITSPKGNHRHA